MFRATIIAVVCLFFAAPVLAQSEAEEAGNRAIDAVTGGSDDGGDSAEGAADVEAAGADGEEADDADDTVTGDGVNPNDTGSGVAGALDDGSYGLRIEELEDQVNELKEDVFRSKSRLFLLREQILQDNIGGARAIIEHKSEFGNRLLITQVLYSLDGDLVFSTTAEEAEVDSLDDILIMNDAILPGPHNISVQMSIEGNSSFFSYLNGYHFTITSSEAFSVEQGQTAEVDVVAFERGDSNEPFEERPTVRFEVDLYATTEVEGTDGGS